MTIDCHFVRAAKDLASLHICTGLPKPSSLHKISCAALNGDLCAIHASSEYSGESAHLRRQSLDNKYQDLLCWQQRLLGVCTFAQARLSLLYSIEISCVGSNGDFCTNCLAEP